MEIRECCRGRPSGEEGIEEGAPGRVDGPALQTDLALAGWAIGSVRRLRRLVQYLQADCESECEGD